MRTWLLCSFVASLLLAGCTDTTEVVVVVDTDLRPVEEIASIAVTASAIEPGAVGVSHTFSMVETRLPLSLSIAQAGSSRGVRVLVHGLDQEGTPLVVWMGETEFREGRSLELRAPLARSCMGAQEETGCPAAMTCRRGMCEDLFIDPSTLPSASGRPPALFEGPSDPIDGGVPPMDAGDCVEGNDCVPFAEPCMVGVTACTPSLTCVATETPRMEGAVCGEGRVCIEGVCGEMCAAPGMSCDD